MALKSTQTALIRYMKYVHKKTGNSHEIIIGGDFNENISGTRTMNRANLFRDYEFKTENNGPTFMNVYGADVSYIDYFLYQLSKYEERKLRKLTSLKPYSSDHYTLLISKNFIFVSVKIKQTLARSLEPSELVEN